MGFQGSCHAGASILASVSIRIRQLFVSSQHSCPLKRVSKHTFRPVNIMKIQFRSRGFFQKLTGYLTLIFLFSARVKTLVYVTDNSTS